MEAVGLVETLKRTGLLIVFASTDEVFAKLPAGTITMLVQPQNKLTMVKLLTYPVAPGKMTAARSRSAIKAGGGVATLTTDEGGDLVASLYDDKIVLTDVKGGTSTITIALSCRQMA